MPDYPRPRSYSSEEEEASYSLNSSQDNLRNTLRELGEEHLYRQVSRGIGITKRCVLPNADQVEPYVMDQQVFMELTKTIESILALKKPKHSTCSQPKLRFRGIRSSIVPASPVMPKAKERLLLIGTLHLIRRVANKVALYCYADFYQQYQQLCSCQFPRLKNQFLAFWFAAGSVKLKARLDQEHKKRDEMLAGFARAVEQEGEHDFKKNCKSRAGQLARIKLQEMTIQGLDAPMKVDIQKYGSLARQINSWSCLWFLLGLMLVSLFLLSVLATNGIATPYLFFLMNAPWKINTLTLGAPVGFGMLWWGSQKTPYAAAVCGFWYRVKEVKEASPKQQVASAKQQLLIPRS